MSELDGLLRNVLADRADHVGADPELATRLIEGARGGRPPRAVRWGVVAVAATAAVVGVVVAVQVLTGASGPPTTVPAAPPATGSTPGAPVRSVTATAGPGPGLTWGPVSLTPGRGTPSPQHTAGCRGWATASPSTPEPVPGASVASPTRSNDAPGDPFSWIPRQPPPAVVAVMADLDDVLDGVRFAGWSVDPTGRSLTVYVVQGPGAAGAAATALSCARSDVPVHVRYVARSTDQLRGLTETIDRSLPESVRPLLASPGETGPGASARPATQGDVAIDVERNRVVLYLHGRLTPQQRHDLWNRYRDALETWWPEGKQLEEPSAAWATAGG